MPYVITIANPGDACRLAVTLWDAYEGEAYIENALSDVGDSLGIDAVEGEGYIDTVYRVCRERVVAFNAA